VVWSSERTRRVKNINKGKKYNCPHIGLICILVPHILNSAVSLPGKQSLVPTK